MLRGERIERKQQFSHFIIGSVEIRHGHAQNGGQSLHRQPVRGVLAALVLVHPGACRVLIDASENAKPLLRKPGSKPRLLEALWENRH